MSYSEMILRFPRFKTRAVTLSFDDGLIYDKEMCRILNEYGMKCTFNINTASVGINPDKLQFNEYKEVYKGHEIACHAYTHPHLNNLDLGGIAFQMIKNREDLEEKTGQIIDGFAYPFGLHETEGMVDCIKNCGIKYARTTVSTYDFNLPTDYFRWNPTCWQEDNKIFELVEEFFKPDDLEHHWRIRPLLFFIWGHALEYKDNWGRLEDICKAIGKKENVWYATNSEIIDYISAFRALRRSVNGKIVHNPTNIDVFVAVKGKNILIEKGQTVTLD